MSPRIGNRNHPLRPRLAGLVDRYLGDRLEPPTPTPEPAPPGVGVGVRGQPDPDPVDRTDVVLRANALVRSPGHDRAGMVRIHSSEVIDRIARDVAVLPTNLSLAQRRRLRIIAKELTRRAQPGRVVTEQED